MDGLVAAELVRRNRELKDRIAQLEAIVEKLPKTGDGVRVIQDTQIYHPRYKEGPSIHNRLFVTSSYVADGRGQKYKIADCYSTKAAAEEARDGK